MNRRRTPEERRRDRAAGVDRYGKPLPRTLGTNPRALKAKEEKTIFRAAVESELRDKIEAEARRCEGDPTADCGTYIHDVKFVLDRVFGTQTDPFEEATGG